MTSLEYSTPNTIAIALGANIDSEVGSPSSTLIAARPTIEKVISEWIKTFFDANTNISLINSSLQWDWSPLFETKAIGGPKGQPSFINAVLIVRGGILSNIKKSEYAAIELLKMLLKIELQYGRDRKNSSVTWGPRTLDIDLLAWGDLQVKNDILTLPHPRLIERNFVIIPLATVLKRKEEDCRQIPPQAGWRE